MLDIGEYLALHRPEWMKNPRRHCASVDTEVFFNGTAKALGICEGCPVQSDCLAYALDNRERGIWGGTTERARKRMIRERNKS